MNHLSKVTKSINQSIKQAANEICKDSISQSINQTGRGAIHDSHGQWINKGIMKPWKNESGNDSVNRSMN